MCSRPAFTSAPIRLVRVAAAALAVVLLVPGGRAAAEPAADAPWRQLPESRILASEAREVAGLVLELGLGRLVFEQGFVFPAISETGEVTPELVFLGRGRLDIEPPDEIEADQLEMFRQQRTLAEAFESAVLVVPRDAWRERLLGGARKAGDGPETSAARALLAQWRGQRERELLAVDLHLRRDALGEPVAEEFFAASLDRGPGQSPTLFVVDPENEEAVVVGRFERPELTPTEAAAIRQTLRHEQRRGRLVGLRDQDIGHWDTWLSAALPEAVGHVPFAARSYRMGIRLTGARLALTGRARIELEALDGGHRGVVLSLHEAGHVLAVRDGAGAELPFVEQPGGVLVVLPTAPALGERRTIEVDWSGPLVDQGPDGDHWALIDSTGWYPQTSGTGAARFDVSIAYPDRLEVVAPGRRVSETSEPAHRVRRFVVDEPTFAFNFQVGRYQRLLAELNGLQVELYLDGSFAGTPLDTWPAALLQSAAQSFSLLAKRLGAPPEKHVSLVTGPVEFSQSFRGFVVFESALLSRESSATVDPRAVIAHELAHQWWGHRVDSDSYRDQWIHEALASYLSLAVIRQQAQGGERFGPSVVSDWEASLSTPLADGRTVESVGPLVLGGRLESSRAPGAYASIVYLKGALVFSTLAELYGEEPLNVALRQVIADAAGKSLSTDRLLDSLGRSLGQDLRPFGLAYIRSTGLPEVTYRYKVTPAADVGWMVEGTARWSGAIHHHFRLRERPGGLPDVVRENLAGPGGGDRLVVPVEVRVVDSAEAAEMLRGQFGLDREEVMTHIANHGTSSREAKLSLRAGETPFRLKLDREPRQVSFSPRGEVLAHFEDAERYPKRGWVAEARRAAAEGRTEEAIESYRRALTAPLFAGRERQSPDIRTRVAQGRDVSDLAIRLEWARLALDLDRTDEAEARLNEAEAAANTMSRVWFDEDLQRMRARLALQRGRPRTALRYLERIAVDGRLDGAEALGLQAVALWAEGRTEELALVAVRAARVGLDIAELSRRPPPPRSGGN